MAHGLTFTSIIIPVYNVGAYISQCLDSVVRQTYQNLEIIIIDDGSTDDGGKRCDEYAQKDKRIQVIHTENNGLSHARSIGLDYVRGAYISFLDSDDWIEPHAIEKMLNIAKQTESDVVVSDICYEYKEKSVGSTYTDNKQKQEYRGQEILIEYTNGGFHDVVWNKLYHVSCLPFLHFTDVQFFEDVFITCGLMKNLTETDRKITALPETLFHQRMRKGSISHSKTLDVIADCWKAYYWKYESLPEYQTQLIPGCIGAIGKMWPNIGGFSKEQKKQAEPTIQEMNHFSKTHFYQIMAGDYSRYVKAICLLSQCKALLFMKLIYLMSNLRRENGKIKERMFD